MSASPEVAAPPVYAVTDGTRRVLATFTEPSHAKAYADELRLAGDPVEVELVAREVTP